MATATSKKKPSLDRSGNKAKAKKPAPTKTSSKKSAPAKTSSKKSRDLRSCDFEMRWLPLSDLITGSNPRTDLEDLTYLKNSIKEHGIEQTLTVRPHPKKKDKFELVAGYRRFACATELKLSKVPVIIRDDLTDKNSVLAYQVSENSEEARTELSAMDQARAFKELLKGDKMTPKKVGDLCGCSDQTVRRHVKLLDAPQSVQKSLREGNLSTGAATAVVSLPENVQKEIAKDLKPGMTTNDVRVRANQIADELGVEANPNARGGGKSKSKATKARVQVTRTRSEQAEEAENIVGEALQLELDGESAAAEVAKNQVCAILWCLGRVDEINIKAADFKKEYETLSAKFDMEEE